MKSTLALLFISFSFLSVHSQTDEDMRLPPFEMLPKGDEVKEIYYLDFEGIFQVTDSIGLILIDSIGEFIDMTPLEKGTYFIIFEGKSSKYVKSSEKPMPKQPEKPKKLIYDFPEKD